MSDTRLSQCRIFLYFCHNNNKRFGIIKTDLWHWLGGHHSLQHSYWQLASVLVREQKNSNQDTKSLRRFCSPECLQLLLLYNLGISVLLYSKKRPIHTLVSATRLPAVVMSLLALDAAHKSNSKHNSVHHEPLPEDSLCSNQARQQLW